MITPRFRLTATLWLLTALSVADGLVAQPLPPGTVRFAYAPEYRSAAAALEEVEPLLSPQGTARILPDGRTVEIRDRVPAVERIVQRLKEIDRPGPRFRLDVMVVQAQTLTVSPPMPSSPEIPHELVEQWRRVLRYTHYDLVARAELSPREGDEVSHELGDGYSVGFKLGPVMGKQRVRLQGFRLTREMADGEKQLIHTTLNPWLGKSLALGLARDETSRTALMVVILCREPESWKTAAAGETRERR